MPWWYVSFASSEGFLGGTYAEDDTAAAAQVKAERVKPIGTETVMVIGPFDDEEMDEHVSAGRRGTLILPGDEHLADEPVTDSDVAQARAAGYEVHMHDPISE